MSILICPSMMCANFSNIKDEVNELDHAGVDIFHMDVMDGHYVPNVALGVEDYKAIRKNTDTMMDIHLMVSNPDQYVNIFSDLNPDIIYVHPDTTSMITRTIEEIRKRGIHPGIAINPAISVPQIQELLSLVDYVLVMTVNPGFAGQPFLDYVIPKIETLASLKNGKNFKLLVDGAISPERISQLAKIGVDGFILGTSALFGKNKAYGEIIPSLRELGNN
ncbi:ribulose-phosphate 3-epimerase [Pediococcus inopinatus]|uniref:ribulose-phosphate 3-epimerase n=1 Tax=Pediococcus inopinatus TaxID=114090 RepID=UPI00070A22EE|nr:ribulose-phosphate 3-epimerase [Pediococcus inopinatus]AVK99175.1 ribulose-phosphate 3-epimerase [Pediococcus inopinatus]KRN60933.1 ribulose-phosphate 3-epimerase [Pediococcus inopinatus]